MKIIQSCIQSIREFDLMDITRLFLVCPDINIINMLLMWQV